jgi:threonine aldolase
VTVLFPELMEKLTVLVTRLNQTTVESLVARLKRQNLLASDTSYLSRNTITNIQNDVAQLQTHFRNALEVERQLEMPRKDQEFTTKQRTSSVRWAD